MKNDMSEISRIFGLIFLQVSDLIFVLSKFKILFFVVYKRYNSMVVHFPIYSKWTLCFSFQIGRLI